MNRTLATFVTASLVGASLLLGGCSAPGTPSPSVGASSTAGATTGDAAALLARINLAGKTPEQVIESLDRDARPRPLPVRASVRSNEVLLDDGSGQARLPLSGDRFYLSIAPYQTRTHECYFHNLGTCQGEFAGKTVHVTITDQAGATLVDADATTYANGFVGFWIPRNARGTVTVTSDGLTGQTSFDSGPDGATCVTTLKIA